LSERWVPLYGPGSTDPDGTLREFAWPLLKKCVRNVDAMLSGKRLLPLWRRLRRAGGRERRGCPPPDIHPPVRSRAASFSRRRAWGIGKGTRAWGRHAWCG